MDLRKKIYISSTIFGIICILLIVFAIYPVFREIKRSSEEFLSEKKNLILLSEEIKDLQESKKLYEVHQLSLEKINELFIDPEIPIEFIRFLEKNATDSQLLIEISPLPTTVPKKGGELWSNLFFQISTKGSFPNFLRFLEKLENGPYLIEVINLNLKRSVEKKTEEVSASGINAVFSIKVFSK